MAAAARIYSVPQESRIFIVPFPPRRGLAPAAPPKEIIKYGGGRKWGDNSVWGEQLVDIDLNYFKQHIFTVPTESRIFSIPGESRIYAVPQEN